MNKKVEVGTLILRLTLGISFFVHGLVKFQGGIENIVGWFDSIGIPGVLAYAVALIEMVGGIALIIGLGTRIVSILLSIIMIGAIFTVKLAAGFLGDDQLAGYELDLAFLAMAVFLTMNGSKMLAVDHLVFKGKPKDHNQVV
ncbi:DoxX family protein [Halalkalibacter alkalisediminis]|uniref:DoxX family protein n=1 Tax=Halalkalibacter alkalisediminis TaxID=935616 RepID=A0ABV6NKB0_9BACI|nr:DoxX family protein [Halalkalibacter alkalisediminis]